MYVFTSLHVSKGKTMNDTTFRKVVAILSDVVLCLCKFYIFRRTYADYTDYIEL